MPLDAVTLRAALGELDEGLAGGRIEKVYQPDREEVVLAIRGKAGAKRLLISVSAAAPRIHLIGSSPENPASPPMFCMLLRKHIQGAKIVSVSQPALERMAVIELDATDELGVPCKKYLNIELMGKYSNLILQGEDGRVIDAVRRVDGDISGKRQVLPGLFYRLPPAQEGKVDPLSVSGAGLAAALRTGDGEKGLDKWLLGHFLGLSPLLCREIAYRATGETGKPVCQLTEAEREEAGRVFSDFTGFVRENRGRPYLLTRREEKTVFDFSCLPITQYGDLIAVRQEPSFSELLSAYYAEKSRAERMNRRAADLIRTVTNARDRARRKLSAQRQELLETAQRERNKRMGDLITANLYQLEKGMNRVKVVDYFDESCPETEIELDVRLTPQQNAQRYYKLYNKAKTAEAVLTVQVGQGERDVDYLESVLALVSEAECEQDLAQLREELRQTGVLSNRQQRGQRQKPARARPYEYRTSDGFAVFAGKNNLQNDLLTMKTAFKSDIWFHTQKIHGSHVILVADGREPTDEAMTEAAMIAAYHSKARGSSLVPVDYTPVRYVKKPSGAKPGFVIYHVYQTAYVTPDAARVEALRVR
ncbi:fibronectin/fibrinogen-binding protein [Clostridiaceae bacterium]|nr:fibronectin/fibrinogen-binding protein [Clostridiaceae bacterium]